MSSGDLNHGMDGGGRESSRIMLDLGGEGATRGKSQLGSQIAFALFVIVLSGGAIAGMRHLGTTGGLSGEAVAIKYQPGKATGIDAQRFTVVMTELESSARPVQYAGEPLDAAPFTMKTGVIDLEAIAQDPTIDEATRLALLRAEQDKRAAEEARKREAAVRAAIKREFDSLRLMGVIGGRQAVARIGNSIVRVGGKVGEHFEVTEILARSVKLRASDGSEWELELPQKSGN